MSAEGAGRGDREGVAGENEPAKGKLAVGSLDKVVLFRFGIWLCFDGPFSPKLGPLGPFF